MDEVSKAQTGAGALVAGFARQKTHLRFLLIRSEQNHGSHCGNPEAAGRLDLDDTEQC